MRVFKFFAFCFQLFFLKIIKVCKCFYGANLYTIQHKIFDHKISKVFFKFTYTDGNPMVAVTNWSQLHKNIVTLT